MAAERVLGERVGQRGGKREGRGWKGRKRDSVKAYYIDSILIYAELCLLQGLSEWEVFEDFGISKYTHQFRRVLKASEFTKDLLQRSKMLAQSAKTFPQSPNTSERNVHVGDPTKEDGKKIRSRRGSGQPRTCYTRSHRALTNFVTSSDGVQIRRLVKQARRLPNWVPPKSNFAGLGLTQSFKTSFDASANYTAACELLT
ncbi:hypothetical protein DFH08DRAFT_820518 [Mycena albidolilacea]|uniref:Uncharacterized protein n=1 Tax=Mycena albidolilacea TaxID=1033008 RepID=A0AAD6ZC45_9AGAR|nr:hypothetical protein DFH08DRAFT_820518 [Mycena albidolilacea]